MNVEVFVQNVNKFCEIKGVNVTDACRESGAGKDLINQIKRGSMPSIKKVEALSSYLGVTTSELLGEKEKPALLTDDGVDEEISRLLGVLGNLSPEELKQVTAFAEGIQAGRKTPASDHT